MSTTAYKGLITTLNDQPHPRSFIRVRVANLLRYNVDLGRPDPSDADLKGRWFVSRKRELFENELPCGLLYTGTDTNQEERYSPSLYRGTCQFVIEVVRSMDSDAREEFQDDWYDSRAYEIQKAMQYYHNLGIDWVERVWLAQTQPYSPNVDGELKVGSVKLLYNVKYVFEEYNVGELDEFLSFHTWYDNRTVGPRTEDDVTIRTE